MQQQTRDSVFSRGFSAAQDGDFVTAHRELTPLAEHGDAESQYILGSMSERGDGGRQDDVVAFKWYHSAAMQGHAGAQHNLGFMFANGRGVIKNDVEALKWFRMSAEQRYPKAQTNVGFMYANGRGVMKNDAEAVKWYRLAAEQGDAAAQSNVGFMYENGRGVTQDDFEAVKWFRLSALQGNAGAQFNLAGMCADGRGTQKDDVEAIKWYRLAAAQGEAKAKYILEARFSCQHANDHQERVREHPDAHPEISTSSQNGHSMKWFNKKSKDTEAAGLSAPKSDEEFTDFLNTVMEGVVGRAKSEQDFYWFLIEVYDFLANLAGTEEVLSGFHLYDLEFRGSKSEESYPGKRNEAAAYVRDQVMPSLRHAYPEGDANALLALTYLMIVGQKHEAVSRLRVKYASHYRDNCLKSGSYRNAEKWAEVMEAAEEQTVSIMPLDNIVPWGHRDDQGEASAKAEEAAEAGSPDDGRTRKVDFIAAGLCKVIGNYGSAQVTESRSLLSGKISRNIAGLIDGLKFSGIMYDADNERKIPAISVHLRAEVDHLQLTDAHIAFWNGENRFSKIYRQDGERAFLTFDAFITDEDKGRIAHGVIKIWDMAIRELPKLKSSYDRRNKLRG